LVRRGKELEWNDPARGKMEDVLQEGILGKGEDHTVNRGEKEL